MHSHLRIALALLVVSLVACNGDKSSSSGSGSDSKSSSRKLKTKLSSKQIEETWAGLKGNHDFKNHGATVTAKLGPAQKTEGDQSCWYGYKPAEGPVPDDCTQLCTSATKGSGTMATDGSGKCWD